MAKLDRMVPFLLVLLFVVALAIAFGEWQLAAQKAKIDAKANRELEK